VESLLGVHVAGGAIGILSGFAAAAAPKGGQVHRIAGRVFAVSMLTMGLSGAFIAAVTWVPTSVAMGTFASYLVLTGVLTLLPATTWNRRTTMSLAIVAVALAITLCLFGVLALRSATGALDGLPAPMAFLFAIVALLAGMSDVRVARSPAPTGRRRLARHLWRMNFALFIAAASFFLGQAHVLPLVLRTPWVLAPPVLFPMLALAYWLWRTRAQGQRVFRAEPAARGRAP